MKTSPLMTWLCVGLCALGLRGARAEEPQTVSLAWRLPADTCFMYEAEIAAEMKAGKKIEATSVLMITIRAPAQGVALLDVRLKESSLRIDGKERPADPLDAYRFLVRSLLSDKHGLDPLEGLPPSQKHLLEMLFPVPENEVAPGDAWPMTVYLTGANEKGDVKESHLAQLERVEGDDGARRARIKLASDTKSGDDGGMKIKGDALFDLDAGRLIENDLSFSVRAPDVSGKGRVRVKLQGAWKMEGEERAQTRAAYRVRALIQKGILAVRRGQTEQGVKYLQDAVAGNVTQEHAQLFAARTYAGLRMWQQALAAIDAELETHPAFLPSLDLGAKLYKKMGREAHAKQATLRIQALMGK